MLLGIDRALRGSPELVLDVLLLAVGIFALWAALFAPPAAKLAIATWLIAP